MVSPADRVAIAVSGGQDSVLLLDFMRQLSLETGMVLAVAHFNHRLRGSDSETDEEFVAHRASDLGLEFFRGGADVERIARSRRQNLEATARDLRYSFLFSLVNNHKVDKVATAHTANDQAETLLLRLLRGTSAYGLAGVYPVLNGKIVRPFLSLTRPEIESEVQNRQLEFRLDASNLNPRFARNRIRQRLLPLLAAEFNPQIVTLLSQLAGRSREDETFLQQLASERARCWRIRERNQEKIALQLLVEFHPAIQRRVIREMIGSVRTSLRGINSRHIEAVGHLAVSSQSGRCVTLPGGIHVRKEFDWLVIGSDPEPAQPGFCFAVNPPATLAIAQLGLKFRFVVAENPGSWASQKGYNSGQVVALDFGKVQGGLVLRNWRPGDRFRPYGRRRALKLKELFLRHRIPAKSRQLWPVLLWNEQVIWVHGFPAAEGFAASKASTRTLILQEERMTETRAREA